MGKDIKKEVSLLTKIIKELNNTPPISRMFHKIDENITPIKKRKSKRS